MSVGRRYRRENSRLANRAFRLSLRPALCLALFLRVYPTIPRSIFRAHANAILTRTVWLINAFYQLLLPIGGLFIGLSDWVLKYIFNVTISEEKESLAPGSLETLFQQTNDNEFEAQELNTELFENALDDKLVGEVDALEDGELAADVVELVYVVEAGALEHVLSLGGVSKVVGWKGGGNLYQAV